MLITLQDRDLPPPVLGLARAEQAIMHYLTHHRNPIYLDVPKPVAIRALARLACGGRSVGICEYQEDQDEWGMLHRHGLPSNGQTVRGYIITPDILDHSLTDMPESVRYLVAQSPTTQLPTNSRWVCVYLCPPEHLVDRLTLDVTEVSIAPPPLPRPEDRLVQIAVDEIRKSDRFLTDDAEATGWSLDQLVAAIEQTTPEIGAGLRARLEEEIVGACSVCASEKPSHASCAAGHLICHDCRRKVTCCPLCRGEYPWPRIVQHRPPSPLDLGVILDTIHRTERLPQVVVVCPDDHLWARVGCRYTASQLPGEWDYRCGWASCVRWTGQEGLPATHLILYRTVREDLQEIVASLRPGGPLTVLVLHPRLADGRPVYEAPIWTAEEWAAQPHPPTESRMAQFADDQIPESWRTPRTPEDRWTRAFQSWEICGPRWSYLNGEVLRLCLWEEGEERACLGLRAYPDPWQVVHYRPQVRRWRSLPASLPTLIDHLSVTGSPAAVGTGTLLQQYHRWSVSSEADPGRRLWVAVYPPTEL